MTIAVDPKTGVATNLETGELVGMPLSEYVKPRKKSYKNAIILGAYKGVLLSAAFLCIFFAAYSASYGLWPAYLAASVCAVVVLFTALGVEFR